MGQWPQQGLDETTVQQLIDQMVPNPYVLLDSGESRGANVPIPLTGQTALPFDVGQIAEIRLRGEVKTGDGSSTARVRLYDETADHEIGVTSGSASTSWTAVSATITSLPSGTERGNLVRLDTDNTNETTTVAARNAVCEVLLE